MTFDCRLEEFEYWLQRLTLELQSGTALRHIVALGRLCELLADQIRKERTADPEELPRRLRLSREWLSLAERLQRLQRQSEQPPPSGRRGWKPRVIQGGRTQSGSGRR